MKKISMIIICCLTASSAFGGWSRIGKLFLLISLLLFFPSDLFAACSWVGNTGTVASPYDDADCIACVTDASSKTGEVTINIPACNVSWNAGVNINMSSGFSNVTQLNIIGAGSSSTLITDTTSSAWAQSPFWVTSANGKGIRISGIGFSGTGDSWGEICILGTTKTFRIDNCIFNNPALGIKIGNPSVSQEALGVVDNCTFITTGTGSKDGLSISGGGTPTWSLPLDLGSSNAVYIENCTFNFQYKNDAAFQSGNGVRVVFRYNTVYNTGTDVHGPDSSAVGGYSWEIYENDFICNKGVGTCSDAAIVYLRGGTGVVYNNTITGTYPAELQLQYFRSCFNESECTALNVPSSPSWGTCNCSFSLNSNNSRCDGGAPVDGNLDATGWPCKQQPGTSFIGADPMYEWGNTINGNDIDWVVHGYLCSAHGYDASDHIQVNRDFFTDERQRPSYTPYIYPHPLTGQTPIPPVPPVPGPETMPSQPTGLTVIQGG